MAKMTKGYKGAKSYNSRPDAQQFRKQSDGLTNSMKQERTATRAHTSNPSHAKMTCGSPYKMASTDNKPLRSPTHTKINLK